MPADQPPVLAAEDLVKLYRGRGRIAVRAVDGVSLRLDEGRTLALVGESGSGKSTMARLLGRLERPTSGTVRLNGSPLPARITREHRRQIQLVFQDPFASLNPVHTIGYNVIRSLLIHGRCGKDEVRDTAAKVLDQVSLTPGADFLGKMPHQLSGGQRQRAAIAAALAVGPTVLLADEPVSMLDVSIRAGLLALLRELTAGQRLALLYITHDIASARYFADSIAVMYQGRIVERGPAADVVEAPSHPYTQLLIAAAPKGGRGARGNDFPRSRGVQGGRPPGREGGCAFAPRCPKVMDRCVAERPPEIPVGEGRVSACWLHT